MPSHSICTLRRARYKAVAEIDRYYDDARGALRTIPGVRVVSTTTFLPFGNGGGYDTYIQEERGDQQANNPAAAMSINTPDFERAIGIPLLRGRSFTRQDDSTSRACRDDQRGDRAEELCGPGSRRAIHHVERAAALADHRRARLDATAVARTKS